jgi:hypothetical protein
VKPHWVQMVSACSAGCRQRGQSGITGFPPSNAIWFPFLKILRWRNGFSILDLLAWERFLPTLNFAHRHVLMMVGKKGFPIGVIGRGPFSEGFIGLAPPSPIGKIGSGPPSPGGQTAWRLRQQTVFSAAGRRRRTGKRPGASVNKQCFRLRAAVSGRAQRPCASVTKRCFRRGLPSADGHNGHAPPSPNGVFGAGRRQPTGKRPGASVTKRCNRQRVAVSGRAQRPGASVTKRCFRQRVAFSGRA